MQIRLFWRNANGNPLVGKSTSRSSDSMKWWTELTTETTAVLTFTNIPLIPFNVRLMGAQSAPSAPLYASAVGGVCASNYFSLSPYHIHRVFESRRQACRARRVCSNRKACWIHSQREIRGGCEHGGWRWLLDSYNLGDAFSRGFVMRAQSVQFPCTNFESYKFGCDERKCSDSPPHSIYLDCLL